MNYFRLPKTGNEIRQWSKTRYDEQEYGYKIKVRSARNPRHVPDSYDDISRPYNERSWKKYRKTQWKYTTDKRRQ